MILWIIFTVAKSGHLINSAYISGKCLNPFIKHLAKCFHFPKTKKSASAVFPLQSPCCPGNQTETQMCCPVLFYWPVGENSLHKQKVMTVVNQTTARHMFTGLYFLHLTLVNSHSEASTLFSPQPLNPSSCSLTNHRQKQKLSNDNNIIFRTEHRWLWKVLTVLNAIFKRKFKRQKI